MHSKFLYLLQVERKKQATLPREQNLLARRMRKDLSDSETKAAIQQLKNKLTPKEVVSSSTKLTVMYRYSQELVSTVTQVCN